MTSTHKIRGIVGWKWGEMMKNASRVLATWTWKFYGFMGLGVIGRRQQVNHLGSLNTLFPPSIYGIDGSKVIMTVYKFKAASRDFISRGTN